MKQYNPFPEISSARGAPMGRRGDNPSNLQHIKRLHARRQGGGDGYDKGGAYWGALLMCGGFGAGLTVRSFAVMSVLAIGIKRLKWFEMVCANNLILINR